MWPTRTRHTYTGTETVDTNRNSKVDPVGWTGWGLLVVAAMFVWAFVMTHLVDNKIQDWLERVHEWGNLAGQRYPDFETEQSELRVALQPS